MRVLPVSPCDSSVCVFPIHRPHQTPDQGRGLIWDCESPTVSGSKPLPFPVSSSQISELQQQKADYCTTRTGNQCPLPHFQGSQMQCKLISHL